MAYSTYSLWSAALMLALLGSVQSAHGQIQLQAIEAVTATSTAAPAQTSEWSVQSATDPGETEKEPEEEAPDSLAVPPPKPEEGVSLQQGRVILDSDLNEQETDEEDESDTLTSEAPVGETAAEEDHRGQIEVQSFQFAPAGTEEPSGTTGLENEESGEPAEAGMTKAQLIEEIATEPVTSRAVYLKFDDIKGESGSSASGDSDAEASSVRFGDGEHGARPAQKPREIVVVGSKVRGWDPKKKEAIVKAASPNTDDVRTPEDLALLFVAATNADARMEEVVFNYERIEFDYNSEARILGLFSVSMPVTYSVELGPASDEFGRLKVKMPWWHVFGRKTVRQDDILSALPEVGETNDEDEHRYAARTFQTVSNTLKSKHDALMATIQNTR